MTPDEDDVTRRRWWATATAAGVGAVLVSVVALLAQRPADDVGRTLAQVASAKPVTAPARSTAPARAAATERPAPAVIRSDASPTSPTSVVAPVRISVPSRSLEARVDPVGVRDDRSMAIPADPDRVGWYRFGPAPGAPAGSVVIAGHVDTARSGPGAFAELADVKVGEDVVVTLADGRSVAYRIQGRQTIVKRRLPTDLLFARDGAPRLVLVTCGGPFQPELRSYRDNVVVTAVPLPAAAGAG